MFDVIVEFSAHDPNLDLSSWLWSTASVELSDAHREEDPRVFHGVVEEGWFVGTDRAETGGAGRRTRYRLRLRPQIHGLAYRERSRIFQQKSIVDVVETTLTESGIPSDAFEWRTTGDYPSIEYLVQWKESELAHVMRRLEANGIYFFFEHDAAGHRLVFADHPFRPDPIDGEPILSVWARTDASLNAPDDCVYDLRFRTNVTHDAFQSRDWDPEHTEAPRQAGATEEGRFPRYEFPGGYVDEGEGDHLAQVRMYEYLGRRYELSGKTTSRWLTPGRYATFLGAQPSLMDGDYLIVRGPRRVGTTADSKRGGRARCSSPPGRPRCPA